MHSILSAHPYFEYYLNFIYNVWFQEVNKVCVFGAPVYDYSYLTFTFLIRKEKKTQRKQETKEIDVELDRLIHENEINYDISHVTESMFVLFLVIVTIEPIIYCFFSIDSFLFFGVAVVVAAVSSFLFFDQYYLQSTKVGY